MRPASRHVKKQLQYSLRLQASPKGFNLKGEASPAHPGTTIVYNSSPASCMHLMHASDGSNLQAPAGTLQSLQLYKVTPKANPQATISQQRLNNMQYFQAH